MTLMTVKGDGNEDFVGRLPDCHPVAWQYPL